MPAGQGARQHGRRRRSFRRCGRARSYSARFAVVYVCSAWSSSRASAYYVRRRRRLSPSRARPGRRGSRPSGVALDEAGGDRGARGAEYRLGRAASSSSVKAARAGGAEHLGRGGRDPDGRRRAGRTGSSRPRTRSSTSSAGSASAARSRTGRRARSARGCCGARRSSSRSTPSSTSTASARDRADPAAGERPNTNWALFFQKKDFDDQLSHPLGQTCRPRPAASG